MIQSSQFNMQTSNDDLTGQKCRFKTYHHNKKKDGTVSIEPIREPFGGARQAELEENSLHAIVIQRFFGERAQHEKTTLQINSPFLLKVFRDVIGSYPTVPSDFKTSVELESPFQMLFHYWDELDQRRASSKDADERMHLNLLFEFLEHEVGPDRRHIMEMTKNNKMKYSNVWCIFRPGDLLYTSFMGQPWLVRCESTEYEENTTRGPYITVHCSYTEHNGSIAGRAKYAVTFYQKEIFGGDKPAVITALPAFPYKFSAQKGEEFEAMLEERGQKYLALENASVVTYDGAAQYLKEYDDLFFDPEMASWGGVWLSYSESGRIILDRKTFQEDESYASPSAIESGVVDPLLCPPSTFAFSISRKDWCRVSIDLIRDVEWKTNAWQSLILPPDEKLILQALVTSHIYPKNARDQAQQKGKGLVILLHGTPGSGKTLTAETAAEASHRGLISTSSGELNKWNRPSSFEHQLKQLLRYATTWEAIVLLDEADVFLEARDDNQSERNALVAVFLRELEYFSGIVFLTTNRVDSFDKAMKSRIHLSLGYNPPDLDSRRQLWTQLLKAIPAEETDLDMDKDVAVVARADLNGREIANAVNTSRTIARFEGKPLRYEHLATVLRVGSAFDQRLKQAKAVASSDWQPKPLARKDSMVAEA